MSIRKTINFSPNYSEINREERNYSAIFFTALCKPGNAEKFLMKCGFPSSVGPDFGIYFEYSYLRDLWSNIHDEEVKRRVIQSHLPIQNVDRIFGMTLKEVNQMFGVAGEPSVKFIEYPGKWAITKYNEHFPDNKDFLNICLFKWSFNIKPDIVIHLDKDTAICIEAKYQSKEGSYPSSEPEKAIFRKRGLDYIGQMELQKYMMEELLGFKTEFMFLAFRKDTSRTHKIISWREAFDCMDINDLPQFAKLMVRKISE